jgi:signal transduction histidine kinase
MALVVAGRLALDPAWGRQHNRHLVFLPAAMLAAWFGGFGPGLVATSLGTAALAYFWSDLRSVPHVNTDLALFFLVSFSTCALIRSLQVARARADAAKKAYEGIMELVVHDLRNPLSAVRMTAEALATDEHLESIHRRAFVITRAAKRMDALVGDLFDAMRAERGDLPLSIKHESAQSIVEEVLDLNMAVARDRGVLLEAELPAETVVVTCDRNGVLRVLANLAGNAIRFTPPGGRISVGFQLEDRAARFSVADTGIGIPEAHLPHVFERHWKGDGAGAGLGLFIARSIVEAHGGAIGADSTTSQGTVFWFTIPLREPTRLADSVQPRRAPA